ncbi:MerR family transcriptional regulator [Aurantimonas coralicida]|jgi:DNA-binding transcriptional MerR regulator|uniref:MerR family transcriptional regulator n=1 Tax=Aurantimonas coralicida TaxID=182270 RepID=UPI001D18237B|nr:helix-turn-helix domain-containing protein [Aurantimonas coralicida]MCC4300090.1 helix-turn-helix domain-containing protein [Aurantimonas coralicida]
MSEGLSIGELSARSGCKAETIRYYEKAALVPTPARTKGGQRRYAARVVDRLVFIRRARELGFSVEAIRNLLSLADNPQVAQGERKAIASEQLVAIDRRLGHLQRLKVELTRVREACRRGRVPDSGVIDTLWDAADGSGAGQYGNGES